MQLLEEAVDDLKTPYTFRLVSTIDEVPAADWDRVCGEADAGIAMDRRFIAATETSLQPLSRFWHVVLYDSKSTPVACTSYSTYSMDLAPLAGEKVLKFSARLRRLVPSLLQSKVLFCGLPVFFGLSHVGFGKTAESRKATTQLAALARRLATNERADLIVFREFDPSGTRQIESLAQEHGYVPMETPPMYHFKPKHKSFEDYTASLRGHYRYKLLKGMRKFENAGFRYLRVTDPQEIARLYTDEVHALYEQVAATADLNVGCLPKSFVLELAKRLPGQVSLGLAFKKGRVVGFGCTLLEDRRFHIVMSGFDREISREGDVYFNMMYRDLAYGMSLSGVDDIEVGQTAAFFKARLGCQPVPLNVYVRAARSLPAMVLRFGFSRFIEGGVHPAPLAHHIYNETSLKSAAPMAPH